MSQSVNESQDSDTRKDNQLPTSKAHYNHQNHNPKIAKDAERTSQNSNSTKVIRKNHHNNFNLTKEHSQIENNIEKSNYVKKVMETPVLLNENFLSDFTQSSDEENHTSHHYSNQDTESEASLSVASGLIEQKSIRPNILSVDKFHNHNIISRNESNSKVPTNNDHSTHKNSKDTLDLTENNQSQNLSPQMSLRSEASNHNSSKHSNDNDETAESEPEHIQTPEIIPKPSCLSNLTIDILPSISIPTNNNKTFHHSKNKNNSKNDETLFETPDKDISNPSYKLLFHFFCVVLFLFFRSKIIAIQINTKKNITKPFNLEKETIKNEKTTFSSPVPPLCIPKIHTDNLETPSIESTDRKTMKNKLTLLRKSMENQKLLKPCKDDSKCESNNQSYPNSEIKEKITPNIKKHNINYKNNNNTNNDDQKDMENINHNLPPTLFPQPFQFSKKNKNSNINNLKIPQITKISDDIENINKTINDNNKAALKIQKQWKLFQFKNILVKTFNRHLKHSQNHIVLFKC